ncbi:MAG TPA: DnaJ domain-containing protein [Kofleriaceae bacterium]|nr:DnaJ domain-containing protein [Kofleriaceae bacterium]
MAELTRGTVFDRPWGRTLASLGLRGLTGQLTLYGLDGKAYEIAFSNGAVIGASSPIASDAAVRVALTGGLVSTTQVAELARKQAASPGRDEVDVISEHLRLGFEQAMRLRRRTIAQRAARSFSVDKGEFVVTDEITLPLVAGSELDVRAIIYLGARQNLSEVRLASELGLFGSWFRLKPDAFEDLPQFGFSDQERPVIDQLLSGASLGDLEAIVGVDVRMVRASLYTLCAANACNVEQTRGHGTTKPPPSMRATDPGFKRSTQAPDAPRAHRASQQPLANVDANRPMGAAGNTMPPVHARTSTITPASGVEIPRTMTRSSPTPPGLGTSIARTSTKTDPNIGRTTTKTDPSVPRTSSRSEPGFARTASRSDPGITRTPSKTNPNIARTASQSEPGLGRTTKSDPGVARTSTASKSSPGISTGASTGVSIGVGSSPQISRSSTGSSPSIQRPAQNRSPTVEHGAPPTARTPTRTKAPRSAPPPLHLGEVHAVISARAAQMEQGADHYTLLGVAPQSPADEIRKSYFNLARQLHPDRLTALGFDDSAHVAHKVFAQLNTAFSVLSDPKRRAEYDQLLARGGEATARAEQDRAGELAARILDAEEAFKKGELALKRDDLPVAIAELGRAVELNPDEPEFYALQAWALFCAAPDKGAIGRQTKSTLERAIQKSPKALGPRFLLGRVHRMLGADKEALELFRDVLADKPSHFDAQSEVRAIEMRLAGNAPKGGGLFGRKR